MHITLTEIIFYGVECGILTVTLLIPLLVMLKIQKLEIRFFPLLLAAIVASAVELIPYAGHFIAVVILLIAIPKISNAAPSDASFTVFISYALAFCFELFLLASTMGHIGMASDPMDWKSDRGVGSSPTTAVATNRPGSVANDKKDAAKAPPKKSDSTKPEKSTASEKDKSEKGGFFSSLFGGSKKGEEESSSDKSKERSERMARQIASKFVLKGIIKTTKVSSAMIYTGKKTYILDLGVSKEVDTPSGAVLVQVSEVGDNFAAVNIAGEDIELWLP